METTNGFMKFYYVQQLRTGEIRPLKAKASICPKLRTDLLSVKGQIFQGYSVVHHPDLNE
jgi:hypothetical protein